MKGKKNSGQVSITKRWEEDGPPKIIPKKPKKSRSKKSK